MSPFTTCHSCNRKAAWEMLFRVGVEKISIYPSSSILLSDHKSPSYIFICIRHPRKLRIRSITVLTAIHIESSLCLPHLRHPPSSLHPTTAPPGLPSPSSALSHPSLSSSSVSLSLPYACADTSANAAKRLSKPPAEAEGALEGVMEPVRWRRDRV